MLTAGVGWVNGSNTSSTFVSTRLHERTGTHSQAAAAVVTVGTDLLSWIRTRIRYHEAD